MKGTVKITWLRDIALLVVSVAVAIVLVQSGSVHTILERSQEWKLVSSFIAGIFFVIIFTAAPAAVVLIELSQSYSLFWVALFAALGGLCGDLVIFRFVKTRLSISLLELLKKPTLERWQTIMRLRHWRWLLQLIGAVIIASPLPDELGVALLGLSKMSTARFAVLSFVLNFVGLLVILGVARAVAY